MNTHELTKGYFFSLVFCITVATSSILIHKTNQLVNPYLSVFLTFFICTIWFNLVNLKSLGVLYRKLMHDKKNLLIINFVTAINWIATFEALQYIDPVLYIALFMGLMPIATYLINAFLQQKKLEAVPIAASIAITLVLGLIIFFDKKSALDMGTTVFYKGVIFTVISSMASAIYMLYSKRFETNLALTTSQIVAVRFYLLIFYSGIICFSNNYLPEINNLHYTDFLVLALLSSIIPMYSIQKSITHIGAIKTSFIVPFTPVFTYAILLFLHHEQPTFLLPLLLVLTCILFYNSLHAAKAASNNPLKRT